MVVRSSLHQTRNKNRKRRAKALPPKVRSELPPGILPLELVKYDPTEFDLNCAVVSLLQRVNDLGHFRCEENPRLEEYQLSEDSWQDPEKQRILTFAVLDDPKFLATYERLVIERVLPQLKAQLAAEDTAFRDRTDIRFFYQYPPTLRLQPGPSKRYVGRHCDRDYGHQAGEMNFWMPLTHLSLTRTTLWIESQPGADDFFPVEADHGDIAKFHGTLCRHFVPGNETQFTRVRFLFLCAQLSQSNKIEPYQLFKLF
eukprot:CAMPEP_0185749906 /NCGR_PEP_ID=MMETSP1174-20130828/8614_1 /TAXON_ID=35687 /ORGANISM="Dictyocha speculum, Strain CCMP1381" /LENGTH=255 /DNA_ID=CAMNT_0028426211 /DNA_START=11 /DNA_END=778 /DNA_ORIENTATION=-